MKPTFLPVHYLVRTEDERMGFIISSVEAGMPLAEMCPAYVVLPGSNFSSVDRFESMAE